MHLKSANTVKKTVADCKELKKQVTDYRIV